MIRGLFRRDKSGRVVVLLGVNDEDIRRLTAGEYIHVKADELGARGVGAIRREEIPDVACDVLIVHGPTYRDVVQTLRAAGIEMPAQADDYANREGR